MQAVTQELSALTAADLMSREVTTLPKGITIQEAVRRLARAHVGGAPVVDGQGRCVGVFSRSDFARWSRNGGKGALGPTATPGCVCSDWQVIDCCGWDDLPAESVDRIMTTDPVLVSPATPLGELARMMVDAQIHRLIVAGADRRPVGIVSSTDVLAAFARATGSAF